MSIDWSTIPDDIVDVIMSVMIRPLIKKAEEEYSCFVSYNTEAPSILEETIYAYFQLLSTSKQFYRVGKRIDFDWVNIVGHPYVNYQFLDNIRIKMRKMTGKLCESEKLALSRTQLPFISEELKRIIRSLAFHECGLVMTRAEIQAFVERHQLVYRLKYRNLPFPFIGDVNIRKLKSIKIKPKVLGKQYKEMIARHESLNADRRVLIKALEKYSKSLVKRRVYITIMNGCSFVNSDGSLESGTRKLYY